MGATFDTLEYVNQLKAVDVPDAQAQVQARALWQALDGRDQAVMALEQQLKSLEANRAHDAGQMATKEDLRLMATKEDLRLVQADVQTVQAGLRDTQAEIVLVRKDMEMMRKDLIIKIGSMFGVSVGLIIAAIGMAVRYLA